MASLCDLCGLGGEFFGSVETLATKPRFGRPRSRSEPSGSGGAPRPISNYPVPVLDREPSAIYMEPEAIQDPDKQAKLGAFCRRLGRESNQGEVGLIVGDEYLAIRDFTEE